MSRSAEEQVAMSEEYAKYNHWYYWYRFSLLPIIKFRKSDQYNEWGFSFQWLFFRVWTMMSPDIGIEVQLCDQDFFVKARIPYLIVMASIPVFPMLFHQKTWRVPRRHSTTAESKIR